MEDESPMSVDEYLKEMYGDLPIRCIALRGLRAREGLTQIKMGEILGVTQRSISQMEHGKRPIGKKLAKRIEELFKTNYRLFL